MTGLNFVEKQIWKKARRDMYEKIRLSHERMAQERFEFSAWAVVGSIVLCGIIILVRIL